MAPSAFSLTSATNIFKKYFKKLSENMYNSANVTLGRVKKSYDFVGDEMWITLPQSFQGGVGSGGIPTVNTATYGKAVITAKKVYAACEIDRETVKASANDVGSYVRGLKHTVEKTVESWNRNMSRIIYGHGDGSLGTIDTAGVSGGDPYTLTITAASFVESWFEEKDEVFIQAGDTDRFEITSVDPDNRQIVVDRISGSQVPADGDVIFMQKSENNDPNGLDQVADATSSTLYSVTVGRRWQSVQDTAGGTISTDKLNSKTLKLKKRFGKSQNMITCSFTQYEKLLNQHEDQKRYNISPKYGSEKMKAKFGFKGLEYVSPDGDMGIFAERFVPDDRLYGLNDRYIEIFHRPDFGWFDDDGTVFLRNFFNGTDSYSALYGGYLQVYIVPTAQFVFDGLST